MNGKRIHPLRSTDVAAQTARGNRDGARALPGTHVSTASDKGVLVGTTGRPALRAALTALARGGSAVDAAMTAALAQTALAAGSWDSYAGIMSLVHYDAGRGEVESMNACYNTVKQECDPLSIPRAGTPSGRSALVSGFMAGVEAAHDRFGRLPFTTLFEPAIALADEGFVLDSTMERLLRRRHDVLVRLPGTRAVFLKDHAGEYREGDVFRQPLLAATLSAVAREGAQHMYRGAWARKLVEAVRAEGGWITLEDLEDYRVIWSPPLRTVYRGHEVFVPGAPSVGGAQTIEALNLLEYADLARHGHYTESPEALYWLIQISHVAHLSMAVPVERRVSKERAKRLWAEMSRRRGLTALVDLGVPAAVGHSDAVVAIDSDGNVASVCHSSNTEAWGTTGIFVEGVSIPDSACFQQQEIARARRGCRLPDPMNPLIVLRDGKPVLAVSSVGPSLHETAVQGLVNALDFGMSPADMVDTPTFMLPQWAETPWLVRSGNRYGTTLAALASWAIKRLARLVGASPGAAFRLRQIVEKGDFREELLQSVAAMGQPFTIVANDPPLGYGAIVGIDASGARQGAVTARGGGMAAAA